MPQKHSPFPWKRSEKKINALVDANDEYVLFGNGPAVPAVGTDYKTSNANTQVLLGIGELFESAKEVLAEYDKRLAEHEEVGDSLVANITRQHHGARMERLRAALAFIEKGWP